MGKIYPPRPPVGVDLLARASRVAPKMQVWTAVVVRGAHEAFHGAMPRKLIRKLPKSQTSHLLFRSALTTHGVRSESGH
eukprot:scaffold30933_cov68-Phaeocystis_antarctica.AAC.1